MGSWNEDTLFASDIVGLQVLGDQLLATVRSQRTLSIETSTSSSNGYDKRWGDENFTSFESALLYLERTGQIAGRTSFSAGLAMPYPCLELLYPVFCGSKLSGQFVGRFYRLLVFCISSTDRIV
jgi:hypothetical protein